MPALLLLLLLLLLPRVVVVVVVCAAAAASDPSSMLEALARVPKRTPDFKLVGGLLSTSSTGDGAGGEGVAVVAMRSVNRGEG